MLLHCINAKQFGQCNLAGRLPHLDFSSAPGIEFVGAALLPEKDNSKDEIFFFYNEVNETAGLDDEPYKARLGRVCKVWT